MSSEPTSTDPAAKLGVLIGRVINPLSAQQELQQNSRISVYEPGLGTFRTEEEINDPSRPKFTYLYLPDDLLRKVHHESGGMTEIMAPEEEDEVWNLEFKGDTFEACELLTRILGSEAIEILNLDDDEVLARIAPEYFAGTGGE